MAEPRSYSAPLVAALLLLLPFGYVGNYYLLVDTDSGGTTWGCVGPPRRDLRYRVTPELCGQIYWPIEQVDRRLRPAAWEGPLIKLIITTIEPETWDDQAKYQSP